MSEFLTPEHYDAYRDAIRALGETQPDGIFDANDVTKLSLTIAPSAGVTWITAGDLLGVVRYFVDLGVLEGTSPCSGNRPDALALPRRHHVTYRAPEVDRRAWRSEGARASPAPRRNPDRPPILRAWRWLSLGAGRVARAAVVRRRKTRVAVAGQELAARRQVCERFASELAQAKSELAALAEVQGEREQAAVEAELDSSGAAGSFAVVRQEGLQRLLGLEENHQRLTRLLAAAEARVDGVERELRDAVADEASGKVSEAVRVRDDAARELAAELDSLLSTYGRLEDARGDLRSVVAAADEVRAAAGLPSAEIPDEPSWRLDADLSAGLVAGPSRPREAAEEATQLTRDQLAASRRRQVVWAGRQIASGYPVMAEWIPVELREEAFALAARLSEPSVLPVPDGYLLHPER